MGVALYRCCQEAVNNAVRHSEARKINVEIAYGEHEIHLTVEDDGKGFDPRTLYGSGTKLMSSGFWTIRQRVADMGGAFRVSTAHGQGTVIEIIVPYESRKIDAKRENKDSDRG
jgi:signal transduction histidine kinase